MSAEEPSPRSLPKVAIINPLSTDHQSNSDNTAKAPPNPGEQEQADATSQQQRPKSSLTISMPQGLPPQSVDHQATPTHTLPGSYYILPERISEWINSQPDESPTKKKLEPLWKSIQEKKLPVMNTANMFLRQNLFTTVSFWKWWYDSLKQDDNFLEKLGLQRQDSNIVMIEGRLEQISKLFSSDQELTEKKKENYIKSIQNTIILYQGIDIDLIDAKPTDTPPTEDEIIFKTKLSDNHQEIPLLKITKEQNNYHINFAPEIFNTQKKKDQQTLYTKATLIALDQIARYSEYNPGIEITITGYHKAPNTALKMFKAAVQAGCILKISEETIKAWQAAAKPDQPQNEKFAAALQEFEHYQQIISKTELNHEEKIKQLEELFRSGTTNNPATTNTSTPG